LSFTLAARLLAVADRCVARAERDGLSGVYPSV